MQYKLLEYFWFQTQNNLTISKFNDPYHNKLILCCFFEQVLLNVTHGNFANHSTPFNCKHLLALTSHKVVTCQKGKQCHGHIKRVLEVSEIR